MSLTERDILFQHIGGCSFFLKHIKHKGKCSSLLFQTHMPPTRKPSGGQAIQRQHT